MRSVLRSIGAVVAGFIVASIVMMIIESINGRVLYPELGKAAEGITDRERIRALVAGAPVGALLVVIVGWILGGIAGGWSTARLSARDRETWSDPGGAADARRRCEQPDDPPALVVLDREPHRADARGARRCQPRPRSLNAPQRFGRASVVSTESSSGQSTSMSSDRGRLM